MTGVVAITGARGFVGSALVAAFAAAGATVRALVRDPERPVAGAGGGTVGFDLAQTGGEARPSGPSLNGVRAVVHCAYDFAGHDETAARRVNVDGTLTLLDACVRGGVEQFVHVSSMAAHAGARSVYGRVKWDLERQLADAAAGTSVTLTIVKPGTVLGRGGLFAQVRGLARRLPALPVFYAGGQLQTVLIDDLSAAIIAAVDRRAGGTFAVAEPAGVSVLAFHRAVAALDGRRPWLVRLPGDLALPALRLAERAGLKLPVHSDRLLGLKHLAHFDTTTTRDALGVTPRDFAASLERLTA